MILRCDVMILQCDVMILHCYVVSVFVAWEAGEADFTVDLLKRNDGRRDLCIPSDYSGVIGSNLASNLASNIHSYNDLLKLAPTITANYHHPWKQTK